jgi:hypothetical protein
MHLQREFDAHGFAPSVLRPIEVLTHDGNEMEDFGPVDGSTKISDVWMIHAIFSIPQIQQRNRRNNNLGGAGCDTTL